MVRCSVYVFIYQGYQIPILCIRLELIGNLVAYRPPLDGRMNITSVQETAKRWLDTFVNRATYVNMLDKQVWSGPVWSHRQTVRQSVRQVGR